MSMSTSVCPCNAHKHENWGTEISKEIFCVFLSFLWNLILLKAKHILFLLFFFLISNSVFHHLLSSFVYGGSILLDFVCMYIHTHYMKFTWIWLCHWFPSFLHRDVIGLMASWLEMDSNRDKWCLNRWSLLTSAFIKHNDTQTKKNRRYALEKVLSIR